MQGSPHHQHLQLGSELEADRQIINGTHEGEPLNAILSANSDPAVLVDSEDLGGFRNYMLCVCGNSCAPASVS